MKPTWIRVTGWVGFGSWYVVVAYLSLTDINKIPHEQAFGLIGMVALGSVTGLGWLVCTIIWKFQQSHARALAAAMGREHLESITVRAARKPAWVRATGWASAILFWASWLCFFTTVQSPPKSSLRDAGSIIFPFAALAAIVWGIATLVWRVTKPGPGSEKEGVRGLSAPPRLAPGSVLGLNVHFPAREPSPETIGTSTEEPDVAQSKAPSASPPGTEGLHPCQGCGKYFGLLYCLRHGLSLCYPCARKHDVIGECHYLPAWRPGLAPKGPGM